MFEGFGNIVEDLRFRAAPEWAMQESVLQKLREGKLEASGVQSAPKQKRQLEVIPEHFSVDAKINWDGNKVTNFRATYSAVRVRRRSFVAPRRPLNPPTDVASSVLITPAGQETGEANPVHPDALGGAPTAPATQENSQVQRRKPGPQSAAEEVIAAS
jgi:hypothetical protein